MFKETIDRAGGEFQKQEGDVSDIINSKYEELQKARLMKMDIEKQMSIPMTPSKAQEVENNLRKLELVIPQLEQEFEDLKKSRAKDLEKKFGSASANDDTMQAPLVTGSEDELLNRRVEGDERRVA